MIDKRQRDYVSAYVWITVQGHTYLLNTLETPKQKIQQTSLLHINRSMSSNVWNHLHVCLFFKIEILNFIVYTRVWLKCHLVLPLWSHTWLEREICRQWGCLNQFTHTKNILNNDQTEASAVTYLYLSIES